MNLKILRKDLLTHNTEGLIVGRFEGRNDNPLMKQLDNALHGVLSNAMKCGDFKGRLNQTTLIYSGNKISPQRVLLVGLGNKREFNLEKLREVSGTAARVLQKLRAKTISTTLPQLLENIFTREEMGQTVVEGTLLSLYSFDEHKTVKKEKAKEVKTLNLVMSLRDKGIRKLEKGATKGQLMSEGVYFSRDLISKPGNVATPSHLADEAVKMAKGLGIKATILEKKDMEKLKMGSLLGVAKGSCEAPKFIILEYSGGKNTDMPYVVIGKAITFDSGGISIKPSVGMEEMKTDMSGGAAAMGTIKVAASLKLPINLVALIPSAENLPSGSACKPGDVLTTMSGQTVEVVNTDAEGRLILADALTYAERFNPQAVIDLATLTGACVIALGHHATGLLGNNEGLKHLLLKAGEDSGERLWELPLWDVYKEQIKSDIADMKNVGGRDGGTITAAAFLSKFATKYHWAHLDIAGTAWEKKGRPYVPKGSAGVGVRLLIKFFENELGIEQN